jgi:hypothetical protein
MTIVPSCMGKCVCCRTTPIAMSQVCKVAGLSPGERKRRKVAVLTDAAGLVTTWLDQEWCTNITPTLTFIEVGAERDL